jgi:hypothetical protein
VKPLVKPFKVISKNKKTLQQGNYPKERNIAKHVINGNSIGEYQGPAGQNPQMPPVKMLPPRFGRTASDCIQRVRRYSESKKINNQGGHDAVPENRFRYHGSDQGKRQDHTGIREKQKSDDDTEF